MRILTTIVICMAATTASAQTLLLEGQILSGTTLFTVDEPLRGIAFDGAGFPEGGYPVSYTALLEVDADQDLWKFRFNAMDAVETVSHEVEGPSALSLGNTNEIAITPTELEITFDRSFSFATQFELDLDLSNGTGTWLWEQNCPVCDLAYALPGAMASVTSIRVVPEPSSLLLFLAGLTMAGNMARCRKKLR